MNQLDLFELPTPSMPVLDVSRCYARPINYETAANMVEQYHYAHRVPSIKIAIGMYIDDTLAGCITYGMPASTKSRWAVCGHQYQDNVLELNRLYIHEWAGHNSESWLVGQSFKLLDQPTILLSFADIGQQHIGYIYQATNWIYTGLSDDSGCFSRIEINGTERTSKSFYDELGTQSRGVILEHYPDAIFHEYTRRQRRKMRAALRWPVLPYPKALDSEGRSSV